MPSRIFVLLLALLASATALAVPPSGYPFVAFDQGMALAQRDGRHIFMYLGRHGCAACRKTNAESFGDAQLRELYTSHFVLVYVDTEGSRRIQLASGERVTEMQFAASLRTLGTPRFIYLTPEGKPVLRVPGYRTAAEFRQFDAYVAGGHYRHSSLNEFLDSRAQQ